MYYVILPVQYKRQVRVARDSDRMGKSVFVGAEGKGRWWERKRYLSHKVTGKQTKHARSLIVLSRALSNASSAFPGTCHRTLLHPVDG